MRTSVAHFPMKHEPLPGPDGDPGLPVAAPRRLVLGGPLPRSPFDQALDEATLAVVKCACLKLHIAPREPKDVPVVVFARLRQLVALAVACADTGVELKAKAEALRDVADLHGLDIVGDKAHLMREAIERYQALLDRAAMKEIAR